MWQNVVVFVLVALATAYIGWIIYGGFRGKAGACGGGCGSACGSKSSAGDLVQLDASKPAEDGATSPDEASAVSSTRSS